MLLKRFYNRQFPRWLGPLIGAIVGAYCGFGNPFGPGALPLWFTVVGGASIGCVAGALVMFLDPSLPDTTATVLADRSGKNLVKCRGTGTPSGVVGRALTLFGLLLSWIPFLGLVLNLIGVQVNRGTDDWAIVGSKFGLVIGTTVSLLMSIGLILGW